MFGNRTTYLVDNVKFPFCKGCGHTHSVRYLDKAFSILNLDPSNINLVSDIGCIGLIDALFTDTHTVHTTHGRSTAFGTGIELADGILHDSRLKTVVILGDGGATIGMLHIITAALMNADLTVIVCNNFLYGMTGGQHSAFTPLNMVTSTTPMGNITPAIDICKLMEGCEAGFIARAIATDRNLSDILVQAITYPGFSLVEILEICPEYGTRYGEVDGKRVKEYVETKNLPLGIIANRSDKTDFCTSYRKMLEELNDRKETKRDDRHLKREYSNRLEKQIGIVLGGTAGERVQLASYLLIQASIMSGLHTTQKNDNPVTQGSGFSISEVIMSPREIYYTGITVPDYVIIVSIEGLKELTTNGTLGRCTHETTFLIEESLQFELEEGDTIRLPFRKTFGNDRAAAGAIGILLSNREIIPFKAFQEVLNRRYRDGAEIMLNEINRLTGSVRQNNSA